MAANKLSVGDEVRHKSGGPKMVVSGEGSWDGEFNYKCEWVTEDGKLCRNRFHPDVLIKWPSELDDHPGRAIIRR